jgi:hypothetical protein
MMHFIANMQYYMMFEVLECSWAKFKEDMQVIVECVCVCVCV